jgi:DNA invertase Pin-like site-specific DNA recombinase
METRERQEIIKRAIFNMGGTKLAAQSLQISPSTIGKWLRNGVIPNLEKARVVAEESGFEVSILRPPYKQ